VPPRRRGAASRTAWSGGGRLLRLRTCVRPAEAAAGAGRRRALPLACVGVQRRTLIASVSGAPRDNMCSLTARGET
jgi:hypothetical protein